MIAVKKKIQPILEGVFNTYSEVFFSDSKVFGVILILITFLDWQLGMAGLLSVIVANGTASRLGFDEYYIRKGYYGFNSLLAGLGLALYFEPGVVLVLIILIAALFSLFITISLKGFLGNYGLPYLSLPFIFTLWIIILASSDFVNLGLNERGIYDLNAIYSKGGVALMNFYQWIEDLSMPDSLRIYLRSLASIFFQQNIFSGILIAFGLLWFSRIAFSLSLIGFYAAYFFYGFIGADFETLNYTYIGFNYILASVAIGGYFLIPSKTTYLWIILIIPLLATLTISLAKIFAVWNLSIYALSFNVIVILFLYVLKLRGYTKRKPVEVVIQNNSPEKNFYAWKSEQERFGNRSYVAIKLPFYGTWTVSQGHNGEYTHKGDWRHAWDFVITNVKGLQYKNDGYVHEDYYCFDKAVTAPADGIVVQVINNVPDNPIGDVNVIDNWGNTVVIKHNDYLFSKLSHMKEGSIVVKEGQRVKFGTVIGRCGNSGRSPYPHLHFQLQSTPYIGSKTLEHPIASYIKEDEGRHELKLYDIPQKDDRLSNIKPEELLAKAFHFIPGEKLEWKDENNNVTDEWEVMTSVYNKSYIYCKKTGSIAWFENDGALFYFTHFDGNRKSLLYHFYRAAFMIQLSFKSSMEIKDKFPANKIFKPHELILQDFIAPFWLFRKADFKLNYSYVDNETFPSEIRIESKVVKTNLFKWKEDSSYKLFITSDGLHKMIIKTKTKQKTVICTKPL
ncbi:MAG: peptidoglycan DD-metalloendopeptidase family protein [Chlorobi bacterium]|nr:peptidoglycan DD-metalloendopeptidase family protein [Chlorobiota bacterium]